MNNIKNVQMLYNHSLDIKNRRIYLLTDVDEMTVSEIVLGLHTLSATEGPIEFWICSGGGELEPSFGLYDVIQRLDPDKTPVHTVATGHVCSAALLLLAAGHRRSVTENCWGMAHTTHGIAVGDADSLSAQTAVALAMTSQMWYLLSLHTKKTAKQWEMIAKEHRELWLTADDLLDYGIVDDVIKSHPGRKFQKRVRPDWTLHNRLKPKSARKRTVKKPAKPSKLKKEIEKTIRDGEQK